MWEACSWLDSLSVLSHNNSWALDLGRGHANIQTKSGAKSITGNWHKSASALTARSAMCCYTGKHGTLPWPCSSKWAVCMAACPPFHERNRKAIDKLRVTDKSLTDFSWLMSNEWCLSWIYVNSELALWTIYVFCKKLAPWVWVQALYKIQTTCKWFVVQLRTFIEKSYLYQYDCIYIYIHTYIYTHLYIHIWDTQSM